jgi:hypothetical protein
MPQLITVTPDPVDAGQSVTISYDFSHPTAHDPVQLEVRFGPGTTPVQIELSSGTPSKDVNVPSAGTAGEVEDLSHISQMAPFDIDLP